MGFWDFEVRIEEELSFRVGDFFYVVRKEEEWWWVILLDEAGMVLVEGYVFYNYLVEKEIVEFES